MARANRADLYESLDEPVFDLDAAIDADSNRRVRIRLHAPDARRKGVIQLRFFGGKQGRQSARRSKPLVLVPGKTIEADIYRARAWFGWFTIPHDIEFEKDENKVREMNEFFALERARTLLWWGDYPRPRKLADGIEPIGPHRFPDVEVQVIEGDGSEWPWLRLHELYGIGEFDTLEFGPDPKELERERLIEENSLLKRELAKLEGMIKGVAASMKAAG